MSTEKKSNSDRILRIHQLCQEHFGAVRFVGVKYHTKIGWIAKVQFEDDVDFGNLTSDGRDATDALRKLKNRVKKIIKRYNVV
jgi:endonuclease V-like protein UPF0215 family